MDKRILKQYCKLCEEIKALEAEKQSLADGYIGAIRITGLPGGTMLSDPTGDLGVKIANISVVLAEQLDKCIALRQEIESVISNLDDPTEYLLMRKRYIEGKTWVQVADEIGYTLRHTTRLHGWILQKIQ